jgi:hypothetical protein
VYYASKENKPLFEQMKLNKLNEFKSIHAVSPGFSRYMDFVESDKTTLYFSEDSHAKMYYLEREAGHNELWIGSANCTHTGLGYSPNKNSECMVKLVYKDEELSAETFGKWLKSNNFDDYQGEKKKCAPEYEDKDEEKALDELIKQICPVEVCMEQKADGKYKATFCLNKPMDGKGSNITIHMFGMSKNSYKCNIEKTPNQLEFELIYESQLTPLLVFKLRKKEKDKVITITRVITASATSSTKIILDKAQTKIFQILSDNIEIIPSNSLNKSGQSSDGNQERNENTVTLQSDRSMSKDNDYEKLLKLYQSEPNKLVDLKHRLDGNPSLFNKENKNVKTVKDWIEKLL